MRIVVGITGGIAAYKTVSLIRLFVEAGHDVKVIPTQNALRFVGSTTLEAISRNTVDPDLYTDVSDVKHVELGQSADLVVIAPATASFIARTAAGIADDLLSNVILATKAPVVIAPAMHTEMWENPATQRNIDTLRQDGYFVIEPEVGRLTGSDSGKGRLPEPEQIFEQALGKLKPQDMSGLRVLVTAGGTREPIDAVRFIGNSSSGKQGLAIAKAAELRGATVKVIAANLEPQPGLDVVAVQTARDLELALAEQIEQSDMLVMAAAVSDYRVANPSQTKLKKSALGTDYSIELVQNPDLLANLASSQKQLGSKCVFVGFAAETQSDATALEALAREKLESKNCDLLIANDVSNGMVFGSERNKVLIVARSGEAIGVEGSKTQIADAVLSSALAAFATQL